jgi:tRNA (guanine37-N1)-methyltransferase
MQVKPIRDCMSKIKQENPNTTVIYLSPQGEKLDNKLVVELYKLEALTLLCGRYEHRHKAHHQCCGAYCC